MIHLGSLGPSLGVSVRCDAIAGAADFDGETVELAPQLQRSELSGIGGNATVRAMVVDRPGDRLRLEERDVPSPGPGQLLVRVHACGVCRTDLHVVDGELRQTRYPVVPGHEIVGDVAGIGVGISGVAIGERVGVPWLGWVCGECRYCPSGAENLGDFARFTGCTIDGGYAEYTVADFRFCFLLPHVYGDAEAAPLLCAGLIGHRAHRMAGKTTDVGIFGFGAATHILAQVAAIAAGPSMPSPSRTAGADEAPPVELDAAIIFAPVGSLVPVAMRIVRKGGAVITAGIHMSDIPSFSYRLLWEERSVRSVANLTRADGHDFMAIAEEMPLKTTVTLYPLEQANGAVDDLRSGRLTGAAVLVP